MPARLSQTWSRPLAAIALAGISLVLAAAVGSIFLSTALTAGAEIAAPGPAGPADGILVVTGLGGTVLALWLGLGMTLSALSALPGALGMLCRQLAARVAPVAVRKVVAFILGTTLTAALIPGTAVAGIPHGAPAEAVVTSQQVQTTSSGSLVAAPEASFRLVSEHPRATDGLTVDAAPAVPVPATSATASTAAHPAVAVVDDAAPPPSWSSEGPAPRVSPSPGLHAPLRQGASPATDAVVVLRGDTLWSIAARRLGPAARAAEIEVEWQRWMAANRTVIGDDADLILPGQLLRPPPPQRSGT
jgi:nucleoid-associated protein YgaU